MTTTTTIPISNPYLACSSTNASTSIIENLWTTVATDKDIEQLKQQITARDKHVDELEADIDFLDDRRKEHSTDIAEALNRIENLETKCDDLSTKNLILKNLVDYLEQKITDIENKINNLTNN